MKLVFMGTPDFAVPSLEALNSQHEIVGVITAPDKPAGRGKKLQQSAIKKKALELGLHILQPSNLKSAEFIEELAGLGAELFVVVAFRMLPESVWSMPAKGTINLHGSLLPQYRGAAPINRAIMNGESITGLTTFFIEQNIDTGEIIDSVKVEIGKNDTAGILHDRMMMAGADLLLRTVQCIEEGSVKSKAQSEFNHGELKKAPKIFREDCEINWSQLSEDVHNHIRGLSPYPGSWTLAKLDDKEETFKILLSEIGEETNENPGTIHIENNRMKVASADKWIYILELQVPGKKRMKMADFLRGFHPKDGFRFIVKS